MTARILQPGEMATIRRVTPLGAVELVREPYQPEEEGQVVNVVVGEVPAAFDENSGTWAYIKALLKERIEAVRKQNDSIILGERETAILRGQLMALKQLVELPKTMKGRVKRPQTDHLIAGQEC